MSVSAKLFNRLLLERLKSGLEHRLRPNQNGFRPLRSTTQMILSTHILFQEALEKHYPLIAIFFYFSKAFDTIRWDMMKLVLLAYNIPDLIVNAIFSLYTPNSTTMVSTSYGKSDPIHIYSGVLQGDTLAPYLFVIMMDYVMRIAIPDSSLGFLISPKSKSNSGRVTRSSVAAALTSDIFITDLLFADDVVLFPFLSRKFPKSI